MRGPFAANTVAGTVSGWNLADRLSREEWSGRMPLARLLADAIAYAESGVPVTRSQQVNTAAKLGELAHQPGFAGRFLPGGKVPVKGRGLLAAGLTSP